MVPIGMYLCVFIAIILKMTRGDSIGIVTDLEAEKEIDNIFSFSCDEQCNTTLLNKGPFKHSHNFCIFAFFLQPILQQTVLEIL